MFNHTYGLDGKILSTFSFSVLLDNAETGTRIWALSCDTYTYDDKFNHDGEYRFFNVGSRYMNNYSELNEELCNIDDDGMYSFNLNVNNDLMAGTFVVLISTLDHDHGIGHQIKSQSFTIK